MSPTYRVLIVDDEHNIRFTLRAILQELGYEVHAATNGQDAQQKLQQQHYDAMLLDLHMPGMPGLELLAYTGRHHPFTAVIVITGYGTIAQAVQAIRGGAVHFLQKPVSPYEIHEALESALNTPLLRPLDLSYDELLQTASHCLRAQEWRVADMAIRHAIISEPQRPEAYSLLGAWYKLQGDDAQAQKLFRVAHALGAGPESTVSPQQATPHPVLINGESTP